MPAGPGVDATKDLNVHSIAIQMPIAELRPTAESRRTPPTRKRASGCTRPRFGARPLLRRQDRDVRSGPWVQVSRLGNPLFNEVIVPMGDKDRWNRTQPIQDGPRVSPSTSDDPKS